MIDTLPVAWQTQKKDTKASSARIYQSSDSQSKNHGIRHSEYLPGLALCRERPSEEEESRKLDAFRAQLDLVAAKLCKKKAVLAYPHGLKMENIGYNNVADTWDIVGSVEFSMEDDTRRRTYLQWYRTSCMQDWRHKCRGSEAE